MSRTFETTFCALHADYSAKHCLEHKKFFVIKALLAEQRKQRFSNVLFNFFLNFLPTDTIILSCYLSAEHSKLCFSKCPLNVLRTEHFTNKCLSNVLSAEHLKLRSLNVLPGVCSSNILSKVLLNVLPKKKHLNLLLSVICLFLCQHYFFAFCMKNRMPLEV